MAEAHRRLLAVLSSFTTETPRLTLGEVMRATDLPASTAHRMLEDLVAADVLVKDERKRYTVGNRMWELGIQAPRARQIRTVVVPVLEQLFLATHKQVVIANVAPNKQMIVEYAIGRNPYGSFGGVGQRLPLHAVSPGFAALAFGPAELMRTALSQPLPRYTTTTITDPDTLVNFIAEVRQDGYAVSRGSFVAGTTSVAVPIFPTPAHFYGAVSVMWEGQGNEREITDQLLGAAREISTALRRPTPQFPPNLTPR